MTENYCKYCHRHFRFKDLYEQHNVTCEYFYKRARERDREDDLHEVLPSGQQQYHLIQHLMLQVTQMQKKITRLEQNNITKKKKMIVEYLNSASFYKPIVTFDAWISSLQVNFDNLNYVFEYDIINGIQNILCEAFYDQMPMVSFLQKDGTLYIYEKNPSDESQKHWRMMSNDEFEKMVRRLSHKMLQQFLKWQIENEEVLNNNEQAKEKNIEYMHKINGLGTAYENKRKLDCKKWIYHKLAKDFTQNVVYEYV